MRAGPGRDHAAIGSLAHDADGVRNLGCEGGLSVAEWQEARPAEREARGKQRWGRNEQGGTSGCAAGGQRAAGIGIAVLAGALFALQARINGELGDRLHDGVAAALVSFGSGLALLLAFAAVSRRMRAGLRRVGAARRHGRLRWGHRAAGGAGG